MNIVDFFIEKECVCGHDKSQHSKINGSCLVENNIYYVCHCERYREVMA